MGYQYCFKTTFPHELTREELEGFTERLVFNTKRSWSYDSDFLLLTKEEAQQREAEQEEQMNE